MAFKNVTPMALATSAVREWYHSLLTPEESVTIESSKPPVTKKDVLSHMNPSAKFCAERVLDWNVSTYRMILPSGQFMRQGGLGGFHLMMLPGYWMQTETIVNKVCGPFAKETHYDDCKRDVRRWIAQEVNKK